MKTKIQKKEEVSAWMHNLHRTRSGVAMVTLFGGDRWSCVTEVVTVENEDGEIIGIATIAAKGEQMSGQPTLIGLYVLPPFRSSGAGFALLEAAVDQMLATGLTPIRLDILNSKIFNMINRLPAEKQEQLKIIDQSMGGLIDAVMET